MKADADGAADGVHVRTEQGVTHDRADHDDLLVVRHIGRAEEGAMETSAAAADGEEAAVVTAADDAVAGDSEAVSEDAKTDQS